MTSNRQQKWADLLHGIMDGTTTQITFPDLDKLMSKLGIRGRDAEKVDHRRNGGRSSTALPASTLYTFFGKTVSVRRKNIIIDQTLSTVRNFLLEINEQMQNAGSSLEQRLDRSWSASFSFDSERTDSGSIHL